MDDLICYEFGIQIWFEDDVWHWGIAQEWESQNSRDVEGLAYGTAETLEAAAHAVGVEMQQIKFLD